MGSPAQRPLLSGGQDCLTLVGGVLCEGAPGRAGDFPGGVALQKARARDVVGGISEKR